MDMYNLRSFACTMFIYTALQKLSEISRDESVRIHTKGCLWILRGKQWQSSMAPDAATANVDNKPSGKKWWFLMLFEIYCLTRSWHDLLYHTLIIYISVILKYTRKSRLKALQVFFLIWKILDTRNSWEHCLLSINKVNYSVHGKYMWILNNRFVFV